MDVNVLDGVVTSATSHGEVPACEMVSSEVESGLDTIGSVHADVGSELWTGSIGHQKYYAIKAANREDLTTRIGQRGWIVEVLRYARRRRIIAQCCGCAC